MGQRAEEAIVALRHGQQVQGTTLIPSLLITRDNLDHPEVQQILSVNWRGAP
jgi:hypothetical protein